MQSAANCVIELDMMADLISKNAEAESAAPNDGLLSLANTKAALVLSVASIALTGVFAIGLGHEARNALQWIMPVGSVAGLLGAAMSLRTKPNHGQAWLSGGTLALAAAAAVSTDVMSISTALVGAGAFATGLAFAFGERSANNSKALEAVDPNAFPSVEFFDDVFEIDRRSKISGSKSGLLPNGSMLVECVHIADRPQFLMACSAASNAPQDFFIRAQSGDHSSFTNKHVLISAQGTKLLAAFRTLAEPTLSGQISDATRELAHELRTPLAAMVGFADALASSQTCTEEMRRTYPQLIASTGRNLIEMTADILQVEALDAQEKSLALSHIVENCLAVLGPMAEQKSIKVFNRVPASLGGKAVDGGAMRQILTNLFSNAIKFSPEGASVELSAATSANGWTLKVTDNGNGLAPEDVARLGQKNFRSDTAQGVAGYGLGLSIVRRLVDSIGARISFESRPGKGTQVTISFPASSLVELSSFQAQSLKGHPQNPVTHIKAGEKHAAA